MSQELFKTQEQVYQEEVYIRYMSLQKCQSNRIKEYLHQVLTKAIFEYQPCCELLKYYKGKNKPTVKQWATDDIKWLTLNTVPYHVVSTVM